MSLYFGNIQQDGTVGSISISPSAEYADTPGGSTSTVVTSSSNWDYDSSTVPAWITVTNGSGTSGQSFSYTIAENTGSERDCNIKIKLTSDSATYALLYVYQAGV